MQRTVTVLLTAVLATALVGVACEDDKPVSPGSGDNNGNNSSNNGNNGGSNNTTNNATNNATNNVTNNGNNATNNATNNGETNPLPLPERLISDFCAGACGDITDNCGHYAGVADDEAGCISACEEQVGRNGRFVGTFTCLGQTCSSAVCDLESPPAEVASCTQGCADLDTCDLLRFIDFPEDQPGFCEAACSGATAGNAGIGAVFECVSNGLDATCDETVLEGCFDFNPFCQSICENFLTAEGDEYCEPGTPLWDTFPDVETCQTTCEQFDAGQRITYFACLLATDCGDPAVCDTVPTDPHADCNAACDAGLALCDGAFSNTTDPRTCGELCTGFLHGLGFEAPNPGASDCVTALGTCPAEGDEQFGALFQCSLPDTAACDTFCGGLEACIPDFENCRLGCTFVERDDPAGFPAVVSCIEAAGADCAAVFACLPQAPVPAACETACDVLQGCDRLTGTLEECQRDCAQQVDNDVRFLSVATCVSLSSCNAVDACDALVEAAVPVPCAESCASATNACGDFDAGACGRACQGAASALGANFDAACITGQLGARCGVGAAEACTL